MNGQDVVAEHTISARVAGAVHTRAEPCPGPGAERPTVKCPREVKCRGLVSRYRIYLPFEYDLVRWDFWHGWCWELGYRVISLTDRDELAVPGGTIVKDGSKIIRRENDPYGFSRRIVYEGIQFQYCPLGPCIRAFNPKIDLVFRAKTFQNFSIV